MGFNPEDDWIRKLLEDGDILSELGLPEDLSEEDIEQIIEQLENHPALDTILDMIKDEIENPDKYISTEIPYDDTKSPAINFAEEACLDLGIRMNTDEDIDKLVVGKKYSIVFPNKKMIIVSIENIVESALNPESFDFICYNIEGADDLMELVEEMGSFGEGMFPIPQQFLYSTIIREVKD